MDREIKFRGIDIDSGKWVIGNLVIDTDGNYQIWDYACHESDSYTYKDVNKESVGQYTGLKDKNSKEIYEGDIFINNLNTKKWIVSNDGLGFNISTTKSGKYAHELMSLKEALFIWKDHDLLALTVVGSIHENPELLS